MLGAPAAAAAQPHDEGPPPSFTHLANDVITSTYLVSSSHQTRPDNDSLTYCDVAREVFFFNFFSDSEGAFSAFTHLGQLPPEVRAARSALGAPAPPRPTPAAQGHGEGGGGLKGLVVPEPSTPTTREQADLPRRPLTPLHRKDHVKAEPRGRPEPEDPAEPGGDLTGSAAW